MTAHIIIDAEVVDSFFTEKFTIDKVGFEPQVRDMGPPNVGKHKRCLGMPLSGDDIFYGIGDLIGIGVRDFEEIK